MNFCSIFLFHSRSVLLHMNFWPVANWKWVFEFGDLRGLLEKRRKIIEGRREKRMSSLEKKRKKKNWD
ncbi:hypothetical protein MtrunA17_Chr4g0031151 [Medicago truncatula]|uniref:Uncharacterized protein n=1 Tax=Medicago truncatula TaxID=3880 RepID=A0A396I5Q7_MEDTR|nr:hypothetical protein MtrunA17_Chr4g0031151 [Medicago truncatula]